MKTKQPSVSLTNLQLLYKQFRRDNDEGVEGSAEALEVTRNLYSYIDEEWIERYLRGTAVRSWQEILDVTTSMRGYLEPIIGDGRPVKSPQLVYKYDTEPLVEGNALDGCYK